MLNCSEATTRLNALDLLNKQFLQFLELAEHGAANPAEAKAALERAWHIKAQLEKGIQELSRELVVEIIVPEAINPYAEALKDAGLDADHPECAEKKEVTFNLEELIKSHCDRYAAQGLIEWVEDIQANQALIEDQLAIPEEIDKIEKRIQAGFVPVLMPSRQAQIDTWQKALQHLKPVWIDNGTEKSLVAPYIDDKYPEKMAATFFDAIPERPYIVWTVPSAENQRQTR